MKLSKLPRLLHALPGTSSLAQRSYQHAWQNVVSGPDCSGSLATFSRSDKKWQLSSELTDYQNMSSFVR